MSDRTVVVARTTVTAGSTCGEVSLAQALHEGMMEPANEFNVVGDRRVERNESKYFGLEQLSR